MAECGSEMHNATRCHLVCIRIPKEQEREMIFDLHQRLLSNQANKNSHLTLKCYDVCGTTAQNRRDIFVFFSEFKCVMQ